MNQLISIVIPVHNEEDNLPLIFAKIKTVFALHLPSFAWEVLFVNDGSTDGSQAVLERLAAAPQVKYLDFSRNFGKEAATSAGLDLAEGAAVLMIDADLQHPAELIPEFIRRWQQGAEVVVGVRQNSKSDSLAKKIGSNVFYRIMNLIGETKITPHATDFRLLDRRVVLAFRALTEHDRMTRGLIDWLGFRRDYLAFAADERQNGQAGYSSLKLVKLALSSFVAHSLLPLKLVGYIGTFITLAFGAFGLYVMVGKYLLHSAYASSFSGPAQLAILIIFLVGMMMASIGLVALYVASIKAEVANRPNYVIRQKSW